jgi:V-type H+-transporting ATPase subunit C
MNWLKVNFSQVFSAWLHLKALRVFSESVLRYGLPVNFLSVIIKPHRKSQKKVHELLKDQYGYLDSNFSIADMEQIDLPGLGFNQADYHPYVFFRMNLDVLEK